MQKNLTRTQFNILVEMDEMGGMPSQERLAERAGVTVGEIRETLDGLWRLGYLSGDTVSDQGYEALEPYRVKRALFMAAGMGTRLAPITLNTPKPMVRVRGERIIDGLLDAVLAAGIQDIVIVRGYLAEQFDQLLYKYPMIRFIDNPVYTTTNNISSAFYARDLFCDAYVFEADLLLHNPKVITKYQYASNFLGFKLDHSDDWCFTVKDGYIASHGIGGDDCYQEFGISYWDEADGRRLMEDIQAAYEKPEGKDLFWTQVPLSVFADRYRVEVRPCSRRDITEIDTLGELIGLDRAYDFKL